MSDRRVAGEPEGTQEEIVDAEVVEDAAAAAGNGEARGNEAAAGRAADQVEQDLDELTAVQRERDEYLELAQRTRADFDNYRKRVANQTAEAQERGKAELAKRLIPVLDNLERALGASQPDAVPHGGSAPITARSGSLSEAEETPEGGQAPGVGPKALAKGVALVADELRATLQGAGVEAYDPKGEPFDPAWHEAISTRAEEGTPSGTVIETLDRGYRLDGQALRPARVVVSE